MEQKNFNTSNYKWSVEGLIKCIKDNKLKSKILFFNDNGAIVHVVSYKESVILGAESTWCISQHSVSWEQYVEKTNGVQLFFYCFNYSPSSDDSLYGATFQVDDNTIKTNCCFTRENNPIAKAKGYSTDEEALMATVVIPTFGDILQELSDSIFEINVGKNKPHYSISNDYDSDYYRDYFAFWHDLEIY